MLLGPFGGKIVSDIFCLFLRSELLNKSALQLRGRAEGTHDYFRIIAVTFTAIILEITINFL